MIIYAPNIHQGGGKVLLEALLSSIVVPCTLVSDERLQLNIGLNSNFTRINIIASVAQRLKAEFLLKNLGNQNKRILCFGNLPPLLRSDAKVDLFFQNIVLLKNSGNFSYPLRTKVRLFIERIWLRLGMKNIHRVFVQSEVVRERFLHQFPGSNVVVAPFVQDFEEIAEPESREFDFVYVASGEAHKNHLNLLKAWEILGATGIYPSLALTLSKQNSDLLAIVEKLIQRGLKIFNFPELSHSGVLTLYAKSKALVYPSRAESFGLPLIEATRLGLPIVASELDFVREFVNPAESFDPTSERSIARAIMRYLNKSDQQQLQKIYSPEEFLEFLNS